jgi:hypothetical protein
MRTNNVHYRKWLKWGRDEWGQYGWGVDHIEEVSREWPAHATSTTYETVYMTPTRGAERYEQSQLHRLAQVERERVGL